MDGGLGACLGDVSLHWAPRKLLGAADQDVQPTAVLTLWKSGPVTPVMGRKRHLDQESLHSNASIP